MKTIIFCTCYLNGENNSRYKKWADYYHGKMSIFNASNLFLIDDGSPSISIDEKIDVIKSYDLPDSLKNDISLFHFENRLGRISVRKYPGWWRSFTFSLQLAKKYNIDKLIHIESDFYIVSRKMIDHIAKISSGWTAFYSRFYKFPETAIQVICKDSYSGLYEISNKAAALNYKFKRRAEDILPFTKVEKQFYGDRFGEGKVLKGWLKRIEIPDKIDYIGQMNDTDSLSDYKSFFKFDKIDN